MKKILEDLKNDKININEAEKLLKSNNINEINTIAKIDTSRKNRTGFPEAILAKGKEYDDLKKIILDFLDNYDKWTKTTENKNLTNLLVTKLENNIYQRFINDLGENLKEKFNFKYNKKAKILIISCIKENRKTKENNDKKYEKYEKYKKYEKDNNKSIEEEKFKIGIITAGTSDIPVGEEARVIVEEGGCEAICSYDVGIAGIHRLFPKIAEMIKKNIKAIIVCAGMEGALPSVVAGLVDVPVIGVPTSVGYGIGGKGVSALYSMLQSCAPGIAVVNIDNGFGAAVFALTIVNNLEK
jgi:NCAIR mutase (PurE)-related protein